MYAIPPQGNKPCEEETALSTTATYTVGGMTCDHCVRSVAAEVGQIPGVVDVAVDLDSGAVTITSDGDLHEGAVRAAVSEAGYELRS